MKKINEYLSTKVKQPDEVSKISMLTNIPESEIEPLYKKYGIMNKLPKCFNNLKDDLLLFETPLKLMLTIAYVAVMKGYGYMEHYREIMENCKEMSNIDYFDVKNKYNTPLFYLISNIIDSYYIVNVDFEKMLNLVKKYCKNISLEDIKKI